MSKVPDDILIRLKIAEVELAIIQERKRVEALKSSLTTRAWKQKRPGETKRLYNLLESRYVLRLMETWPDRSFYSQVEMIGFRDKQGKLHPAKKTRILDWAEISGNEVQGGDIKSETAIKGSVKGGKSGLNIHTVFRSLSTIEEQRASEADILSNARRVDGKLVLRGWDVVTDSHVNFEVHRRDYFRARLNTYAELPDKLLGLARRGPVPARVIPMPTVAKTAATTPEPVSKLQAPVQIDKAGRASTGRRFPTAEKTGTIGAALKRGMEILSVSENERLTAIGAKSVSNPAIGNRMTARLNRFAASPKVAIGSFALGLIAPFIGEGAAARRFEERMRNDGYVPVGSEYEVSGEYSKPWRLARLIADPSIPEKMKAIPLCLRFDMAAWRGGIRRRANLTKVWDSLTVRFPVAMQGGESFRGASAVFEKLPLDDARKEWRMVSLAVPSGALLKQSHHIDLDMIIDHDRDDEWVLDNLRLKDAMVACWESVEQYQKDQFDEEFGVRA